MCAVAEDLIQLKNTTVNTLDIQDNRIWDPDVLPEVFAQMPNLRVLYLKGNPCSKKIPNYRTFACHAVRQLAARIAAQALAVVMACEHARC